MNKLYTGGSAPMPKLFRVTLMPPKESLTGDKEKSPWDLEKRFIVRADDPGQAAAKAAAFFNASDEGGGKYEATEISVYGECTENPDVFTSNHF